MAEDGFGEKDPLMEHTDDRNDDDDGDTTGPFQPGSASTPGPGEQIPMRTTTMNRPPERGSHTAETSFIEGRGNLTRELQLQEAQKTIKYYYPDYDESLDFTINARGKIVAKGSRGGDIEVFKSDKKSLLAGFINRFKKNTWLAKRRLLEQSEKRKGKIGKICCRSTKSFKRYLKRQFRKSFGTAKHKKGTRRNSEN